jgi:hypothetical protein
LELRRPQPRVKPAKLHIPEFEGDDADSWIQTLEQYYDSARTPLDQQTEIAVTYLKGPAVQWWRGTGFTASSVPWHHFTRYITDRFSETSICDNVKTFHELKQTTAVSQYILEFEKAMNLMRRDNPTLPDDYYVNSFISGLHTYIQSHLQCLKPNTMQDAMWYARRIEMSTPKPEPPRPAFHPVKRQVYFEQQKPAPQQ